MIGSLKYLKEGKFKQAEELPYKAITMFNLSDKTFRATHNSRCFYSFLAGEKQLPFVDGFSSKSLKNLINDLIEGLPLGYDELSKLSAGEITLFPQHYSFKKRINT
ncbi:MAG: hypothetical protein SFT81_03770 [Candidatus Caenarcaniphilales bacterium]|nr:hypothetical protein [Candidatus Caenarcaniphilales bacterium]